MSSNMLRSVAGLSRLALKPYSSRPFQPSAFISTSKKNREGTTITADQIQVQDAKSKSEVRVDDFSVGAAKKKWISYGFDWETEEEDLQFRNFSMFVTVTLMMIGIGFYATYQPDIKRSVWSQREAYIRLAEREALGLPPIDENLVPPENINLPTEEELGNFEVIV